LYYNQSLYKDGWSRFKQGDNERSLDSFAAALDSVLIGKRDPPTLVDFDSLSRPNRELVEDTFRVMSITFSYLDGARSIGAFLERSGPRPYAYLLYTRLGDLYLEKERYTDAADTYHAFVARDSGNEQAPALQLKAMEAYAKGGFSELVLKAKKEFLEGYGFGTPYWRTRTPQGEPVVAGELKKNLQDVAQYYHAQAQRSHGAADYQEAVKWYRAFLTSFPDDPLCAQVNFLLADTLYESKHYLEAAQEYDRTASGYGEHPKAAAAGYAAIVALGKEEESLSGADKARVHAREIDSSLKFAQVFPLYPETPQVLIRAATDLSTAKDYPRATAAAQAVLDRQPPVDAPKQRIAWTVVANAEFDRGDFVKAEAGYSRALGLMAPKDPERSAIVERLAAAIYREGEEKNKSGNGVGAVEDFLRVAKEAPASPVRASADFDAAALLMSQREWARAITVLEQFRRDFPQSPLQADVTRKLAVAYAESNRAAPAAAEFARIAHSSGETSEVQREALQRAAELYEKTGDFPHARAMLEEFVTRFPQPLNPALEARNKLGVMAAQSADGKARDHWLREIIAADRNAGAARTDRSRALAARATLVLAEPARAEFMQTKLAAPLKKSLLQKRRSMEAALKQYEQAADYQIADVTTAATYESAELYRQLAKDLLHSERPRSLSTSELEQYNVLLEEQAFPFEEKAIKLHEVNAVRTKDGRYDEWVQKSFAALAQLNPGRYAKVEIGSATMRDSRLGEAEADLMSQVERRPDDAAAGNELGIVERKLGKFAEAEATYERTIAQVPNYASTYLNLGVLYDLYLAEP
ncbi:MAG: tetratricopeptide repeat protein, partial [Pseudomonadota bacterium]|nr:tetratricopeptide repeat protein [Pseudomonadota bacterium]